MLDSAVDMLGPDVVPLTRTLVKLGERHLRYGVMPDHYPVVGQALLSVLENVLGDKRWTPEVKRGWSQVYGLISSAMISGAENYLARREGKSSVKASTQFKPTSILKKASKPSHEEIALDSPTNKRQVQQQTGTFSRVFGTTNNTLRVERRQPESHQSNAIKLINKALEVDTESSTVSSHTEAEICDPAHIQG